MVVSQLLEPGVTCHHASAPSLQPRSTTKHDSTLRHMRATLQHLMAGSVPKVIHIEVGPPAGRLLPTCQYPGREARMGRVTWYPEQFREPVSYTHLRAHETRHDLVCR